MVLDEVDSANAKMASRAKSKDDPKVTGAAAAPTENPLLKHSKEWWDRAPSLAPAEIDSSIVNCELRGGAQFMSKNDCLNRGGQPQGVSG